MIIVKRVYDNIDSNYKKILVDKLWPRGISREKYLDELNHNQYAIDFKNKYKDENIILLYSAKNDKCNNAIVLKEWLERNN